MAFTVAINNKVNLGNQRVHQISCSVDSASGNVVTGLKVVEHVEISPISMASAAIIVKKNIGSGATAVNGTINFNGMATGDVFFITAYGR
jgi:translation initiation factor 1 (eIF-1/SUI1)